MSVDTVRISPKGEREYRTELKRGKRLRLAWSRPDAFQKTAFVFLTLLAAFMLLPIVFVFSHAFKPINELFLYPPRFWVMEP
ncbi:MAG: transporter permease, partial [Paenibacillus sp.]|nr:transporter permease [Paenibacillus sp.]